jgi:hypothetical protein
MRNRKLGARGTPQRNPGIAGCGRPDRRGSAVLPLGEEQQCGATRGTPQAVDGRSCAPMLLPFHGPGTQALRQPVSTAPDRTE